MDDSQWTWPLAMLGDHTEVVALVVVLGALGLRVLPSTRRWAPRGNSRHARPGSAASFIEPGSPQEPAWGFHPAPPTGLCQQAHSWSSTSQSASDDQD